MKEEKIRRRDIIFADLEDLGIEKSAEVRTVKKIENPQLSIRDGSRDDSRDDRADDDIELSELYFERKEKAYQEINRGTDNGNYEFLGEE